MMHLEDYHQGYTEKNKTSLMGFFSLRLRLRYNQPISIKRKNIIHLMRTQNGEPSRSSWNFNLPNVTIGVKYFPSSVDKGSKFNLKYEQMTITLDNNKIVGIIYEI
jgi:hypothetical protein